MMTLARSTRLAQTMKQVFIVLAASVVLFVCAYAVWTGPTWPNPAWSRLRLDGFAALPEVTWTIVSLMAFAAILAIWHRRRITISVVLPLFLSLQYLGRLPMSMKADLDMGAQDIASLVVFAIFALLGALTSLGFIAFDLRHSRRVSLVDTPAH